MPRTPLAMTAALVLLSATPAAAHTAAAPHLPAPTGSHQNDVAPHLRDTRQTGVTPHLPAPTGAQRNGAAHLRDPRQTGLAPRLPAPTGAQQNGVVPRLPAPTGVHRVGVVELHLTDTGRPDPWEPERGARDLMASVYYPASTTRGYPVAPHMRPGAAAAFAAISATFMHPELPDTGVDWAGTKTHAHLGAPAQRRPRPVLLYTPGGGEPRSTGTVLAAELASRGFVVVTVDHPGDVSAVEFPDGTVRTIDLTADPRTPEGFRKILGIRLADIRFVLDELHRLRRDLPAGVGRAMNLDHVGVFGHSLGGTAAAQSLHDDRRVDAAVNLEGFLDYTGTGELLPVAAQGTTKPLLLFGTDGYRNDRYERAWSAMLANSRRTTERILPDATHWVFTDYTAIAPQLQSADLMTPAERTALIGATTPERAHPAIHNRVTDFFTKALRH